MTVEYSFDISYPPGEDHTQIKQDIEGNVTESLQYILSDTSDILFPLRQNYGLAFSKEEDANTFVYEQEDAVGKCSCLTYIDFVMANLTSLTIPFS